MTLPIFVLTDPCLFALLRLNLHALQPVPLLMLQSLVNNPLGNL